MNKETCIQSCKTSAHLYKNLIWRNIPTKIEGVLVGKYKSLLEVCLDRIICNSILFYIGSCFLLDDLCVKQTQKRTHLDIRNSLIGGKSCTSKSFYTTFERTFHVTHLAKLAPRKAARVKNVNIASRITIRI